MTFAFPFTRERLMGTVHQIDGTMIEVLLPYAATPVGSAFGERLPLGSIGEFIVVDVGDLAVVGRLLEIFTPSRELMKLTSQAQRTDEVQASGRIQLLCTLQLNGRWVRGVARHPRVGDQVYSASKDVLEAVVGGVSGVDGGADACISLGLLTTGTGVPVVVPAEKLFGRHLAVLGATGAGKSWTLARLMESVADLGGKLLLIDATGEFHTLGDLARHVSLGELDEPAGALLVGLPHHQFGEADRSIFLRPAGGVQLPKMRAAIRSLRLAHHVGIGGPIHANGTIKKAGKLRSDISQLEAQHAALIEKPDAEFDLKLLPNQIGYECVWDTDRNNDKHYGGYNTNDLASCNPLSMRVRDLLQTSVVVKVVCPPAGQPSVLDVIDDWYTDGAAPAILRVSLRNLAFSHSLREIVVNTIGRHLLANARDAKYLNYPLVTVVDEAHQFFGRTLGDEYTASPLDAFDAIAKEGRKYGLTICMATQRPADVPPGVLSQAGMMIVHRLADKRDQDRVEQASSELDQAATRLLPSLIPGEALLVGADFPVPLPVRISRPGRAPASRGPDFSAWSP